MFCTETFLKFYNEYTHLLNFLLYLRISTEVLIIMSSPGKREARVAILWLCLMATSSARDGRNKGVRNDPCVLKKNCPICKAFTPEQIQQLATPTYRDRKNKEKEMVSASPTPTLVDPSQVNVLGRVEGQKVVKQPETTPAGKKERVDESPKASKRKPSSRPSTDDLKNLDDKWAERFARLEAKLLAKSFAVPVKPVVKPAEVITSRSHSLILVPVQARSLLGSQM